MLWLHGHDAEPVRCCTRCNNTIVQPARLKAEQRHPRLKPEA
jgi:hypothetical protein